MVGSSLSELLFFSLQTFSRLFLESPQKLHKPCAKKREQWPPPGLTLKKQKNGPEIFFFHWFPLVVVSGGGCGTDADAPPTLAASSKLHTLAVSGRTSNISLSRGKTSSRRWKMAQNSLFILRGEKLHIW